MSEVITLANDAAVDRAWKDYRDLAAQLVGHPEKLTDRSFMEDLKRAERKFTRLFNMQEAR